jgi:mannose-6-phosphate isomerase-like protein (cupin superfamily)
MTLFELKTIIKNNPNDQTLGYVIRSLFGSHQDYEERPWGYFEVLLDEPNFKVKRFVVKSGKRLSYQYHKKRSENWVVVQGNGLLTLNAENKEIGPNSIVHIEKGDYHRVHNIGIEDLIIIETQFGEYCGEDDIVRIDDDFNR